MRFGADLSAAWAPGARRSASSPGRDARRRRELSAAILKIHEDRAYPGAVGRASPCRGATHGCRSAATISYGRVMRRSRRWHCCLRTSASMPVTYSRINRGAAARGPLAQNISERRAVLERHQLDEVALRAARCQAGRAAIGAAGTAAMVCGPPAGLHRRHRTHQSPGPLEENSRVRSIHAAVAMRPWWPQAPGSTRAAQLRARACRTLERAARELVLRRDTPLAARVRGARLLRAHKLRCVARGRAPQRYSCASRRREAYWPRRSSAWILYLVCGWAASSTRPRAGYDSRGRSCPEVETPAARSTIATTATATASTPTGAIRRARHPGAAGPARRRAGAPRRCRAARIPCPYLETMCRCASVGGLLPEQVWDATPSPSSGSPPAGHRALAMPLVWSHADSSSFSSRASAAGR